MQDEQNKLRKLERFTTSAIFETSLGLTLVALCKEKSLIFNQLLRNFTQRTPWILFTFAEKMSTKFPVTNPYGPDICNTS